MIDGCGRKIDHLRLSLTDHCNLACRYCVPKEESKDPPWSEGEDPLCPSRTVGYEGIDPAFAYELVRWLAQQHGIRHVRLTGGEPLLYRELLPLVEQLSGLDSLAEVSLTTNGQALARKAEALAHAGLARVNISLDTLDPQRFAHGTRGGKIAHTLGGIEAAVSAGLTPVKVNVVAQRGVNDEEIPDLAAWGLSRGSVVRFLEVMPIGPLAHVADEHLVPATEILERLSERFELRLLPQTSGRPAQEYAVIGEAKRIFALPRGDDVRHHGQVPNRGRTLPPLVRESLLAPRSPVCYGPHGERKLLGVIGIIAATTRPFCSSCRRLRITSRGQIIACVHDKNRFDLNQAWDGRRLDIKAADGMLMEAVMNKPAVGPRNQGLTMLAMGG